MNNAVKPEYVPCEPDFEVNVDSPLAKLMCSLSAEEVQANRKMLVECLNILSACYLTHLFPNDMMNGYESLVSREFAEDKEMPFSTEELHLSIKCCITRALEFKKNPSAKELSVLKELIYWLWKLVGQDIPYECIYRNGIPCVRSKRSYKGVTWGGDDYFTNLRKAWGTDSVLDALYEALIENEISIFINSDAPITPFPPFLSESEDEYEDSLYEVGFQLRKAYPEFRAIPWKEEYDDYAIFNYCRFY